MDEWSAHKSAATTGEDFGCYYYTVGSHACTSTGVIRKIPFLFSPLKPTVAYCGLEVEDKIDVVMRKLPYRIESNDMAKIPYLLADEKTKQYKQLKKRRTLLAVALGNILSQSCIL